MNSRGYVMTKVGIELLGQLKTATATATKNYIDDEEAGECNCIAMHLKIELMMMVQGSVIA